MTYEKLREVLGEKLGWYLPESKEDFEISLNPRPDLHPQVVEVEGDTFHTGNYDTIYIGVSLEDCFPKLAETLGAEGICDGIFITESVAEEIEKID